MEWTNYKAVALIDWLMLRIEFKAPTQRQWVQKELRKLLSLPEDAPDIWVKAIKPKAGGVASAFWVVLHDTPANDMALLEHLVASLSKWHPIEHTSVDALEVSIDFHHADHNGLRAREATRALQTGFAGYGNNPRQYDPETGKTLLLANRPGVIDQCTFYVGNHRGRRKDPICARIYNKVTDHNKKSIPASKHRARAEITLQHGAPARLGITDITSLKAFPFDSLTEHFHFRRIKDDLAEGSKLIKEAHAQTEASNSERATFLSNLAKLTDKLLKEHGGEHAVGWPFGWVRQNPGHGPQPRRTHSRHTEPDKPLNAKIKRALEKLLK